jgi:MoxR-like ATPase
MGKWTTIYAPQEFKDRVKALSEKTGKAQWKVLLDALALYETQVRKPRTKGDLPAVDKVIWYVEKLAMSVGALKERPNEEALNRTLKTIQQVRGRLGVNTALLEKAVKDYVSLANASAKNDEESHAALDEATMELNMALKSALVDIIFKHLLKEEGPSEGAGQAKGQAA